MQQVKKRNGTVANFEQDKITSAMRRAFQACRAPISEEKLLEMSNTVVAAVTQAFTEQTPSVENVQDAVELVILREGFLDVARSYIAYRYEHEKIREEKQQEFVEKLEDQKLMITNREGKQVAFDENRIRTDLARFIAGYEDSVDVNAIVGQIKFELFEGMSTNDIARALIMIVRSMIERDPAYSKVASRLHLNKLYGQVFGQGYDINNLQGEHTRLLRKNIEDAVSKELLDPRMMEFDFEKLASALKIENDDLFEYMGLEILSSRYCMEDTKTKMPTETPQLFWMRIAMGIALNEKPEERDQYALEFYDVLSNFYYTPGGRTLFQAGALKAQLANCFLNVVPDSLDGIFKTYADNAQYLKWSGGLGTSWSKVRSTGSFIKGTGVGSQGVVPFLKIANDVNTAINRSGKRRGAGTVYLESWHLDIEDFLELRKNTGDERRRTHDIDTANWIPDLFMKRVRENEMWTLFSPSDTPDLHEIYGKEFETAYLAYEARAKAGEFEFTKQVSAADLWKKMLAMLFETGHPWITWKDPSNIRSPQDHAGVVHSSNLCTEITLNTSADETAVCNLGSLNFAVFVRDGKFDHELVGKVVRISMRMLDNIIDLNYYPTPDAKKGNMRHRPVGLGVRGYHDALYMLGIDFDSQAAVDFADESMEVVAYYAILGSSELAKERGVYETYKGSKWDRNIFPQDTLDLLAEQRGEEIPIVRGGKLDWTPVRAHVQTYGMRNSNTMAIAPTASTANLVGCIPCVEPIYKNIYVKSNKEGDFTVINKYLVQALKKENLWNADILNKIKFAGGSIQDIHQIPAEIRARYKEVFEIDARWIIEAAARRGKWIDQSQSLNIFYNGTSGRELSEIYFYAWRLGLKTTYYLRSLGASQVEKATVSASEFGSTHTRTSSAPSAHVAAAPAPVAPVEPSAHMAGFASAPLQSLAEKQAEAEKLAEQLARVAAGEEVGLCESCQG